MKVIGKYPFIRSFKRFVMLNPILEKKFECVFVMFIDTQYYF